MMVSESDTHWVCRECIGHNDFEEFTVGLGGAVTCEVCTALLSRPNIACVSDGVYQQAASRKKKPSVLPCPFCKETRWLRLMLDSWCRWVHCTRCGTDGPVVQLNAGQKAAAEQWNQKVSEVG